MILVGKPCTATPTQRIVQVALRVWHSPMWADYVGGSPNQGGHLAGDSTLLAREKIHHQLTRDTRFVDAYSCFTQRSASFSGFPLSCWPSQQTMCYLLLNRFTSGRRPRFTICSMAY